MPRLGRYGLLLVWLLPLLGVGWTVQQAPAWLEPRLLRVTLEPGQSLTLGREALWAPQADGEHVRLTREPGGGWRLSNLSPTRQVLWRSAGGRDDRSSREWPLQAGARFTVGTQTFTVQVADGAHLALQAGPYRWDYDGLRLRREGQALPECYPNWRTRLREWLGEVGLRTLVWRPLRLGGGVYCADRLGLPGVPVDWAALVPTATGFALRPGWAGRPDGVPVTLAPDTPQAESLWQRSIPLARGDRLIIGRTRFQVVQTAPDLELAVLARAQRWPAGSAPPRATAAVAVQWGPTVWLWPDRFAGWDWMLGLAALGGGLGWLWAGQRRDRPWWQGPGPVALALALAGVCLAAYLTDAPLPVLWPYGLAWLALGLWLATVRSPWSAALLALLALLLGSGLMALLQLGVGVGESGWLRHGGIGALLAGGFGWLSWGGWKVWQWRQPGAGWRDARWGRWLLRLLMGAALVFLVLQTLFGDENGWAGMQPFELTKLTLVAVAAYALTLRARLWGRNRGGGRLALWLRYLSPLALLALLSGFALVFLRDFSPLVLLLLWSLALAWAYLRPYPRPLWRWCGQGMIVMLLGALGAGLAWLHDRPEDFPLGFQADRIRVWVAPAQYPHAGYQLRRGLEAIRAGGWWGTVWSEGSNGRVMTVPALENDFMPTFFLNRYGGLAGLALVGLQAAFLGVLLSIAGRARDRTGTGDERRTALNWFGYFSLYGGAAMLGAHLLISWGTNLGFLPVMGQPMPLLSAAGSHLALFVLPIVALAVAIEEGHYDDTP